nr:alkene reductase [Rhodococcus sp. (in: high G+C Gram-positive bacteria)]
MTTIFEPTDLGAIELKNRLVMAPMTRNRATIDGCATPSMATYYAQRASAGLIVTEGIQPSVVGQGFTATPGLHSAEQIDSWRAVTDGVHAAGGRIVAQLMHSGRIGHPSLYPSAHMSVAPSAIAAAGTCFSPAGPVDYPTPTALSVDDIEQATADFVSAAEGAIDAGFDGVEIHAGNGFLLHQFLADNTNVRTDAYGGSIQSRVRFPAEVIDAVAAAIGADRVGVRISPANPYNDIAESDTLDLYRHFVDRLPGLSYLHVMESGNRSVTTALREQWTGALVLNPHEHADSGPVTAEIADGVLATGVADAVCFGALFLANPDLPARIQSGGPYNALDDTALYGGGDAGYIDYPVLEIQSSSEGFAFAK